MKNILFLFATLLGCTSTFAQDHAGGGVSSNSFGYNTPFAEGYDEKGRPFTEAAKQITGTSVLNPDWGKGEVKFQNGFRFKDMELQFDLYKNQLFFRKDGIGYSFVDALSEFSMEFKDSLQTYSVKFRSGYPSVQKNTATSFYEVVADGRKVQLLNYVSKEVRENVDYLGPQKKEYQLKEAYYVYDVQTGKMKNIELKKNALLKALPAYADSINSFAEKNNYKLKSEREVAELFALLNQ